MGVAWCCGSGLTLGVVGSQTDFSFQNKTPVSCVFRGVLDAGCIPDVSKKEEMKTQQLMTSK